MGVSKCFPGSRMAFSCVVLPGQGSSVVPGLRLAAGLYARRPHAEYGSAVVRPAGPGPIAVVPDRRRAGHGSVAVPGLGVLLAAAGPVVPQRVPDAVVRPGWPSNRLEFQCSVRTANLIFSKHLFSFFFKNKILLFLCKGHGSGYLARSRIASRPKRLLCCHAGFDPGSGLGLVPGPAARLVAVGDLHWPALPRSSRP